MSNGHPWFFCGHSAVEIKGRLNLFRNGDQVLFRRHIFNPIVQHTTGTLKCHQNTEERRLSPVQVVLGHELDERLDEDGEGQVDEPPAGLDVPVQVCSHWRDKNGF